MTTLIQTSAKTSALTTRPELDLLLSCARSYIDPKTAERIRILIQKNIQWEYLIQTAARHEVIPLLYQSLKTTCLEAVPKDILDRLRNQVKVNTFKNLFLAKELLKVLNLFEEHGISAIPFKGAVLAASVYGNLALRQFCDLDILVRKKDFLRAKELLLSQQYQPQLTELEAIFVSNHALQSPFQHRNGMVSLDLHWGIAPRRPRHHDRFKCLWNNLESVSLAGQSVLTFSPEATLTVHCINAAKEWYKPSLKPICDIAEIIQAYPNLSWKQVFSQAQLLGSQRLLLIGLYLAHDLLGTVLPDEVLQKISAISTIQKLTKELKQRLFQEADSLPKNPQAFYRRQYRVNKYNMKTTVLQDRPLYYLDKIITPHGKDIKFISLPSSLYFLYYLIRPIRIAGECGAIFGQRFRNLAKI